MLNVSPALTDASSDSLKERTVQMTFEDHVSDPDSLKTGTPAVMLVVAYAYQPMFSQSYVIDSPADA